jgi:phosphonoacetaldehyde hydrolase
MSIRLAVFDLGGTIVDKYSLSPFISLKHAFKNKGINIPNKLIFKDMGKNKLDHISLILNNKYIAEDWFTIHETYPTEQTKYDIFNEFNVYQLNHGINSIEILPETKSCINTLQENNISTGVTTGFNKPITMNIRNKLIENNIYIDKYISSTCLGKPGRPEPHMIKEIMNTLSIEDPRKVIKIDDTVVGIEEGNNCGCITIGVAKWSTNMKITEYNQNISKEEHIERLKNSRKVLWSAKPDYVINSLNELYPIIQDINT